MNETARIEGEKLFQSLGFEIPEGTTFESTPSGYIISYPDGLDPDFPMRFAAALCAREEKRKAELERLNEEAQCGSKSTT
jgi:hypothetical protein